MGAFGQQPLDDVDVHLVAVLTNRIIAIDVPMTVDEIIHIAAVPLTISYDILDIKFSRLGE